MTDATTVTSAVGGAGRSALADDAALGATTIGVPRAALGHGARTLAILARLTCGTVVVAGTVGVGDADLGVGVTDLASGTVAILVAILRWCWQTSALLTGLASGAIAVLGARLGWRWSTDAAVADFASGTIVIAGAFAQLDATEALDANVAILAVVVAGTWRAREHTVALKALLACGAGCVRGAAFGAGALHTGLAAGALGRSHTGARCWWRTVAIGCAHADLAALAVGIFGTARADGITHARRTGVNTGFARWTVAITGAAAFGNTLTQACITDFAAAAVAVFGARRDGSGVACAVFAFFVGLAIAVFGTRDDGRTTDPLVASFALDRTVAV